ncbi:hypothetical protein [Candidatus Velamenicoccus archaeovorus]|uniref:hypothetical protein n=1 Tax=Velamenicoccus archaeovorus TaxID=1930593 RepID=UPI000FFE4E6A|nr:hypothetical protein [Candidatus Velamenicoccus archaeovorus]
MLYEEKKTAMNATLISVNLHVNNATSGFLIRPIKNDPAPQLPTAILNKDQTRCNKDLPLISEIITRNKQVKPNIKPDKEKVFI